MQQQSLWVLGHRVRPMTTDDSYGLVEVTSPPGVPGPPPHHHRDAKEFFLVVSGTLDVNIDNEWKSCPPGTFIELAEGTNHTFINNGDNNAVWITGWRPKGFEQFFKDFGVPVEFDDAAEKSVASPVIQRVQNECRNYGMYPVG